MRLLTAALAISALFATPAYAQQDRDTLARRFSNPIADLIGVPLQLNADFAAASDGDGALYTLNVRRRTVRNGACAPRSLFCFRATAE